MEDLAQLEALAATTDGHIDQAIAAEMPPDPNAPPPPPSLEEQARDGVNLFCDLLCGAVPEAAPIWSEERRAASASVMVPVMEKYGWTMTAIPCELAAVVVIGPALWATVKIVKAKNTKAQEQVTAEQQGQPEPVTGPEVAVHPQMGLYP